MLSAEGDGQPRIPSESAADRLRWSLHPTRPAHAELLTPFRSRDHALGNRVEAHDAAEYC